MNKIIDKMPYGRILSNISFVFWAIELHEKYALDIY
jgi:hypothetical protein